MPAAADLPYRPCAGIMLLNHAGQAWLGRRADEPDAPEGPGSWWQMPQGGIDGGEDAYEAALRELYEETNVLSVSRLAETPGWLTYELPPELVGKAWGGRYRGQRVKWFALRFEGPEFEIDVDRPGGGKHEPEFTAWRWAAIADLPAIVVPFKRALYAEVVASFSHFSEPAGGPR